MSERFKLLSIEDSGWDETVFRTTHDVYHLRAYARACSLCEPQHVQLAVVDDGHDVLLLPIMVRPLPGGCRGSDGLCDVTVPYGYPAPLCTALSVETVRSLLAVLVDELRSLGAVSLFARSNPFVGIPREAWEGFGTVVSHGQHVWIDTSAPEDAMASFRYDHRTGIRKLRTAGFEVQVDAPGAQARFPLIYRETMHRINADPYFMFNDAYFETLFKELDARAKVIEVISPEGDVAAAALLLSGGEYGQYHLSGTAGSFLGAAPAKLTIPGMIEVCAATGVRRLNLGSGTGGREDGVFKFKSGFSRLRAPFESVRVVLDEPRYRELSADSIAPESFFPAYRAGY